MKNNRLYRSFKDSQAKFNGYLDDYAFLIAGFIDLYEATNEIEWLKKAISLDKSLEKYFEDKKNGGFFMTSDDHEKLLARERPSYDGAEPTGNSIHVMNLLRFYEFTTDYSYRKRAEKTFKSFSKTLKRNPMALSEMLLALDFYFDKPMQIIIVTPLKTFDNTFVSVLRKEFLPNKIIVVIKKGADIQFQGNIIPLIKNKIIFENKTTAYVCKGGVCKYPTTNIEKFLKQIREVKKMKGKIQ